MSTDFTSRAQRFSIRKCAIGVASVMIGLVFMAEASTVSADQVSPAPAQLVADGPKETDQPVATELIVEVAPLAVTAETTAPMGDVKEIAELPTPASPATEVTLEETTPTVESLVTELEKTLETPKLAEQDQAVTAEAKPVEKVPTVTTETPEKSLATAPLAPTSTVEESTVDPLLKKDKPVVTMTYETREVKEDSIASHDTDKLTATLVLDKEAAELEKGPTGPVTRTAVRTAFRTATRMASSGTYYFTSRASIKAEPKLSSPELAYYDAGQSVYYDSVLEREGYQWISYVSYSGNRRYIAVKPLPKPAQPAQPAPVTTSPAPYLPSSGSYTFTSRVSVKGEPKQSAPELAYYNAGQKVYYDSKVEADGYQWISYVNYNGGRSYIPIYPLRTNTTTSVTNPTPSQPARPTTNLTSPHGRSDYQPNYYTVGECTWGAKELAKWANNTWGNAYQWADNARIDGFTVGDIPVVGAIIVWAPRPGFSNGHVGVVTHVANNSSIKILESNFNGIRIIQDYRGYFNPRNAESGVFKYIYPPAR